MSSRLAVPLLCAAAVVAAVGQGALGALASGSTPALAMAAPAGARQPAPTARRAKGAPPVDAALDIRVGSSVRFALHVVNQSEHRLELDFADGQTREFVVLDTAGREVWRWSHGRLFTQNMQNRLLAAGDTVTFEERWPNAVPGRYTVVATLRSDNHPLERRADFVVPASGARVAAK